MKESKKNTEHSTQNHRSIFFVKIKKINKH